jgi:RNA polymerase sigma factor (sigma-70 family)
MPITRGEHLVKSAQQGSKDAFAALVECHYATVYSLAFAITGDWHAAEDLTQETFLVVWENLSRLRNHGAFLMWIRKIARNLAFNWRRSRSYQRRLTEHYAREVPARTSSQSPEDILAQEERRQEIGQAMQRTPTRVREVMALHYLQGYSIGEISQALDITANAVKKRLQRGRSDLGAFLEKQFKQELEDTPLLSSAERVKSRILEGLAAGPAVSPLGQSVSGAGLSVWAHHFTHGGAFATLRLGFKGGIIMTWQNALILGTVILVIGAGAYLTSRTNLTGPQELPDSSPLRKAAETTEGNTESDASEIENSSTESSSSQGLEVSGAIASSRQSEEGSNEILSHDNVLARGAFVSPATHTTKTQESLASIAGVVTTPQGDLVPNAKVLVIATGLARGNVTPVAHALAVRDPKHCFQTKTDAHGAFMIEKVPYFGETLVSAQSRDAGGTQFVELSPGQAPANVTVIVKEGVVLAGRVLTTRGTPVTDARVYPVAFATGGASGRGGFGGGGGMGMATATSTDQNGLFDIIYPTNGYAGLHVVSESYGQHTFCSIPVGSRETVDLNMPKPARLVGRISYGDSRSGAGLRVYLTSEFRMSVRTDGPSGGGGGGAGGPGAVYAVTTDADGAYEIANIDPDASYEVSVCTPEQVHLSRTVRPQAFRPGETATWDYVIENLLTMRGRVFGTPSGAPLGAVRVSCLKEGEVLPGAMAETKSDGSYELVVASDPGPYQLVPHYPHVQASQEADLHGKTVQLDSGQIQELDLSLPDPLTVAVRVVDPGAVPVPGASIGYTVKSSSGSSTEQRLEIGKTDEQGRFSWSGFGPGARYILNVEAPGYFGGHSSEYEGEPGAVFAEETVVLYRTSGMEGVAVDAQDRPIANAMLLVELQDGDHRTNQLPPLNTTATGSFSMTNALPATVLTITIRTVSPSASSADMLIWRSEPIEFVPNEVMALGKTVFVAPSDTKP